MRTSVTFPDPLLYRLKVALTQEQRSMTSFVVELVEKALNARDHAHTSKTYAALDRWVGSGPRGITDAARTVNETLYCPQGAWRDHDEPLRRPD
jgi:hypothetical protein